MKLFNKLMALLMTIAMISTFTMTSTFAAGNPTLKATASKNTVKVGETVDVTISLSDNPGLYMMYFRVSYSTGLTLTAKDDSINKVTAFDTYTYGQNFTQNPYNVCWETSSMMNGTGNGDLLKLTFTATEVGTQQIGFEKYEDGVFDENFTAYDLTFVPVTVTVVGDEPADDSQYFATSFKWGEKAQNWTGVEFKFTETKADKSTAKLAGKAPKTKFSKADFEADMDVTLGVKVAGAPEGSTLTLDSAEWYK